MSNTNIPEQWERLMAGRSTEAEPDLRSVRDWSAGYKETYQPDVEQGWQSLRGRMEADRKPVMRTVHRRSWWSIAAGVAVLVLAAVLPLRRSSLSGR